MRVKHAKRLRAILGVALVLSIVLSTCSTVVRAQQPEEDKQKAATNVKIKRRWEKGISSTFSAYKESFLWKLTEGQIRAIARRYDLFITDTTSVSYVPTLKNENPDLIVLIYRNIIGVYYSSATWKLLPDNVDWWYRDSAGNIVKSRAADGGEWWALDIGNPDFQEWTTNYFLDIKNRYGVDGVFYDSTSPLFYRWHLSNAINPRTGREYSQFEATQEIVGLINAFTSKGLIYVGGSPIPDNIQWLKWQNPSDRALVEPIIDAGTGFLFEGFIGRWYQHKKGDVTEWEQQLEYYTALCRKGKIAIAWAYVYNAESMGWNRNDMAMFSYASYLLAKEGKTAYFTARGVMQTWDVWQADVGDPTENYDIIKGTRVYKRDFTKARVLVNPTTTVYYISSDGEYRTPDGRTIDIIVMKPYTGMILFKYGSVTIYPYDLEGHFSVVAPEFGDVKFRGTVVSEGFSPDYDIRIEEVLEDPSGDLHTGDYASVHECEGHIMGSIEVGDLVEVYGEYRGRWGDFPHEVRLYKDYHYTRARAVSPPADFEISASPPSRTFDAGQSTTYTVTVTSVNGFSSEVSLSLSGLPDGSDYTFNPNPVTQPSDGSAQSTLTVSTTSKVTPDTYTLTITGTSKEKSLLCIIFLHSHTVTLTVPPPVRVSVPTSLSIKMSKDTIKLGKKVKISGTLKASEYPEKMTGTMVLEASKGSDWQVIKEFEVRPRRSCRFSHSWRPEEAGDYTVRARYSGDETYSASESDPVQLTVKVKKIKTGLTLKFNATRIELGQAVNVTITLKARRPPTDITGEFLIEYRIGRGDWTVLDTITIERAPTVTTNYVWKPEEAATYTLRVTYLGDDRYQTSTKTKRLTVRAQEIVWKTNPTPLPLPPLSCINCSQWQSICDWWSQ